jgi:3-deoxy-D-manno-octulosonic-acid transferase
MSDVLVGKIDRRDAHLGGLGLTRLEHAYGFFAPVVFGAIQAISPIWGASFEELQSRRGLVPRIGDASIWLHGASAGEMSAAQNLSALLHDSGYRFSSIYTSTNRAGLEFIRRSHTNSAISTWVPWDTARALDRAFDRWKPKAIFLVETELWPRMVFEAYRRDIPIFLVSGRIYPQDVSRYRLIKPFIGPTLNRLTMILAQDEQERSRFLRLGAPAEVCFAAGNLKHLNQKRTSPLSLVPPLNLRKNDRLVVAGSLHDDEIVPVLDALHRLERGIRILVAPRHASGVEIALRHARVLGRNVARRSDPLQSEWEILVLDTMGELAQVYALATCAIVGGGFGRHGGHNLFEPVVAGAPVLFGQHFGNFAAEARLLAGATPTAQLASIGNLHDILLQILSSEGRRLSFLSLQSKAIPDKETTAKSYLNLLGPRLDEIEYA